MAHAIERLLATPTTIAVPARQVGHRDPQLKPNVTVYPKIGTGDTDARSRQERPVGDRAGGIRSSRYFECFLPRSGLLRAARVSMPLVTRDGPPALSGAARAGAAPERRPAGAAGDVAAAPPNACPASMPRVGRRGTCPAVRRAAAS